MDAWAVVNDTASVVSLLGLPYLVVSNRRRVPRFSFDFSSSTREFTNRDNMAWCRFTFSGLVRNQSLDQDSIQRIFLVVWHNKRHKATRRFGFGARILENGVDLHEPIAFGPREGKKLEISFEVALTGSDDARLATETQPITPGSNLHLPKYEYELAFEDISGNLFDRHGALINRRGLDLRWTIGNTMESLKGGNPLPFFSHWSKIYITDAIFFARRMVRRLGI